MTTFEKRSDGTYDDRDSHDERHSHGRDNHQRHAGLPAGVNVMSTWTLAFYDYAEQILKAQRQFAHSMLGAAAPMLDVAREVMSADVNEDRSANNQLDAGGDQRHRDSNRLRRNERYNDDAAEYNNRSADDDASDANGSDINRTERANTQAEQSGKTRSPVAASATARKRP